MLLLLRFSLVNDVSFSYSSLYWGAILSLSFSQALGPICKEIMPAFSLLFYAIKSSLLIWALLWKFLGSCSSFTAPCNGVVDLLHHIFHLIRSHFTVLLGRGWWKRPEGADWKIKPPNSFTEMSVEHTHRSIRQWKWHSKWHVFFPLYTLKMLVLIDSR